MFKIYVFKKKIKEKSQQGKAKTLVYVKSDRNGKGTKKKFN